LSSAHPWLLIFPEPARRVRKPKEILMDREDKILGSWLGRAVGEGFLGQHPLVESFA